MNMDERSSVPAPPRFIASLTDDDNALSVSTTNDKPVAPAADSYKQQTAAPPPPKFSAPPPPPLQQRSRPAMDPAKAAVLAAAKAAQHATPAQRERMVMEAAAQALAQRTATAAAENNTNPETTTAAPSAPAAPLGPYQPPLWACHPPTMPFTMEIMKQGTIISILNLQQLCSDANKGFLILGRAPTSDILLDHPSSSRLHAVLEFSSSQQEDGESPDSDLNPIFLFDPGSTHGCYVNKVRIAAGQHIPLNVGDMLRFGESSRIMILCGPAELMVEEGPSREQRKQAAALEALKRRKEKDAAAAKLAMAKAIAPGGGGGVSWGFREDAHGDSDEENGDGRHGSKEEEIDWREHASNKGLTDKQQKFADKIRKREARIMNLQKESEKIQLKQRSMEEMSAGQASALARNEEEVEKAMIEIEELEDQLVASIEDSISGKKKIAGASGKRRFQGGKKRQRGGGGGSNEDSDNVGDSDEDSFYDRTRKRATSLGSSRTVKTGGAGSGKSGRVEVFEDAASLYGALEAFKEEKIRVEALLVAETTTKNVDFNFSINEQRQPSDGTAVASPPTIPSCTTGNETTAGVDSLDDFMAGVESTIESDRAASLRKELSEIESKINNTAKLLKIADPDNFYKPGSKAAELAVQRARKAVHIEQGRKIAEERQKKEILAAKVAKEKVFVEEKEEEERGEPDRGVEREKQAHMPQLAGEGEAEDQLAAPFGLQLQTKKDLTTTTFNNTAETTITACSGGGGRGGEEQSAYENRRAGIAASLQALKSSSSQPQRKAAQEADAATAKVLADLAVLQQAKRGSVARVEGIEGEEEGKAGGSAEMEKEKDITWLPPDSQKGDGRTSLNGKFGY